MALSVPLLLAAASPALAQSYPARNITMIVPFPAGGPSDTVARIMAEGMSRHLGHNVIIENVGGADVKQGVDGIGGTSHMACLLFNKMFGLKPTLVIYRDAECAGRQGGRRARQDARRTGDRGKARQARWHRAAESRSRPGSSGKTVASDVPRWAPILKEAAAATKAN